jgi:hypothetical protein
MSTSMLQSTFNNHMFWNAPNEAQMVITAQQFSRPDITRILERFPRRASWPLNALHCASSLARDNIVFHGTRRSPSYVHFLEGLRFFSKLYRPLMGSLL